MLGIAAKPVAEVVPHQLPAGVPLEDLRNLLELDDRAHAYSEMVVKPALEPPEDQKSPKISTNVELAASLHISENGGATPSSRMYRSANTTAASGL